MKRERLVNKLLTLERKEDVWNFIKVTLKYIQVWIERLIKKLSYLRTTERIDLFGNHNPNN